MIPGAIVTVFLVDENKELVSNSLDIGVDNHAESQVYLKSFRQLFLYLFLISLHFFL